MRRSSRQCKVELKKDKQTAHGRCDDVKKLRVQRLVNSHDACDENRRDNRDRLRDSFEVNELKKHE